ncbi:hypothetical protein [Dictyobacter kobayashii]|uniref:Uncharacterized protein n=1 Tax=Dictyobacter kobayashii TaxID=2014872 RepID=A0A402AZ45_9CHLR|nr:hypothetical protein [Dictyobacter kobayashii]GCE24337.1 hypothetical protein KDK_81370 [Dictyobacter kobayashii]
MKRSWGVLFPGILLTALLVTLFIGGGEFANAAANKGADNTACKLNSPTGAAKHVISIQFDNVHFTRDNPNVPSDLEQMPNLLNFIKNNGTLLSNYHTPLIAHTADDILTSLTGLYGQHHGVSVANSYRYFNPDGTTSSTPSFTYWTAPVSSAANAPYNMITAPNTNTPAPWVSYTRAGCNVGSVATANTVLENINTDIPTVFGANSPEAAEVKSNSGQAYSDFVGIGIHCAQNDALCSSANNGKADVLPNEPGGYTGFQGLFGHKYVAPQISPSGPLLDLNGQVIQDSKQHIGFPGFDGMSAAVSLSYVAAMQEHNVPVTYAYISDAHDPHGNDPHNGAYGPGEAGYVKTLKSYDDAFGKFFARLQKDGINASNTIFDFSADENDHFAGGPPTPANCDGVTVPCTYQQVGEVNGNLTGLLATQQNITTPFTVHADSAPTIYLQGNPSRQDPTTRNFARALGNLTATNPYTGQNEKITNYLADPVEMNFLHMVTADPTRTPTLTMFAKPDYYLYAGAPNCNQPCIQVESGYAWNHGDLAPDINTTWLGLVGPGVRHLGVDHSVWADQTDLRPTLMSLLGLKDDYTSDGRALFEVFTDKALPQQVRSNKAFYIRLGQLYKQINAPVGQLALLTVNISTQALESNSANDQTYNTLENELSSITTLRDTLAHQIHNILDAATFGNSAHVHVGAAVQQQDPFKQGQQLFKKAQQLR